MDKSSDPDLVQSHNFIFVNCFNLVFIFTFCFHIFKGRTDTLVVEEEYPSLCTSWCQEIHVTADFIAAGGSDAKIVVIKRGHDNNRQVYTDSSKTSI